MVRLTFFLDIYDRVKENRRITEEKGKMKKEKKNVCIRDE